jgi:hypothetical protein
MALRESQDKYDTITVEFVKERSQLEAKYQKLFGEPLGAIRRAGAARAYC